MNRAALGLAAALFFSAGSHASLDTTVCETQEAVAQALDTAPEALPQAELDLALIALFLCKHPADQAADWMPVVQTLLDRGADPNWRDPAGRHSLMHALANQPGGSLDVNFYRDAARLLLANGADPLTADDNGTTPLHLAAGEADGAVTELLLDLNADPLRKDNAGASALALAAAQPDNLTTFEKLLNAAMVGRDPDSVDLESLANRALAIHDHGKLNLLLQLKEGLSLPPEAMTMTLAVALWQGAPLPVAERLEAAGAQVPALHDQGGGDLAWRLASLGHAAELDWLLENSFELDRLPDSGFPPLYYAHEAASELLLKRGADPALTSAEHGPVAAALYPPPPPFDDGGALLTPGRLQLLLSHDYPLDLRDPQGRTALEHAVARDSLWLVQALLQAGANPLLSSDGSTSLLPLALSGGRLPLIQTLLRAIPDHAARHPDLLIRYLSGARHDLLVLEALLVAGAPLATRDERGDTVVLVAARRQLWDEVLLLLRYGANPLAVNRQGCSLRCFEWSMPGDVRSQLVAWLGGEPPWQPPALMERPSAFFALASVPATALWLGWMGLCLYRRRSLLPPTGMFALSVTSGVFAGGALFYRCAPCVLAPGIPQLGLTAAITAGFMLLFMASRWQKARKAKKDPAEPGRERD